MVAANPDFSDFLLSRQPLHAVSSPFPLIEFERFVSDGAYSALESQFPEPNGRWPRKNLREDRKWNLASDDSEFDAIIAPSPAWQALVRRMRDNAFLADLASLFLTGLKNAIATGNIVVPAVANLIRQADRPEIFVDRFLARGQVRCEFIVMEGTDLNMPHTDGSRKIVSLLSYFPMPQWRPEYGGETLFYRLRDEAKYHDWFDPRGNRIPLSRLRDFERDTEVFFQAPYRGNRSVAFGKCANSFHAVAPFHCLAGLKRRVFQMSLKL